MLPKKLIIRFKNPYIHGTLLIEKNILNKIGNYNEYFYFAQDYKLFWDLNKAGYKVKNSFLTLYELNMENNISNKYKSEQQYCQYFTQAREVWENGLQNKLEQMLEPAANQLRELLEDPNPSIRQRAIDQIMKYTGRDIERKLIKAEVQNITIGFQEE